jgi:WD40 repeat protein
VPRFHFYRTFLGKSIFSRLPILARIRGTCIQEGRIMSRDSRDGRKPHEYDDDAQSNHSADQNDLNEQEEDQPQDESQDSERLHRRNGEHRGEHNHRSGTSSRSQREHHSRPEMSDDDDASPRDDEDAETPRQRRSDPAPHLAHDRPHDYIDDEEGDRVADHSKFVSYDDDTQSADEDDNGHAKEPQVQRSYRAEPAHRPFSDFRGGAPREALAGRGLAGQQLAATRSALDASPYSPTEPATLADATAPYGGSGLHPYEQHRAVLIGLSTALVAAIAVIVALMINLSTHKDLAQSALKDRNLFEGRLTAAQQDIKDAQTMAAQRAREAQTAISQAAENQRLAQSKNQAYLAAQDQLRRNQGIQQQAQEENQRKLYVTQIRLAKQAWDRGDTNEALRLLEPYHTDPAQQKLCTFAWYYLWRAAHNGGSVTLRGHSDVVRQAAVTPDGSQIITFGDDGQLIAWDAAVGRKLTAIALERNVPPRSAGLIVEDQLARRASGLVIANNGVWAAAYGRNLYLGSNIRQADAARAIADHQLPIISLAISGDGKRLASGDYSGEIILRDATNGRVLQHFHNPRPQALLLTNDGGLLLAGMHDGSLFAWNTNTGKLSGSTNFGDGINSMALTPDSSVLAIAMGVRDGVVKLWEPSTGHFRGDLRGHHDEVLRVVWSRDGKSLLTASRDQTACLWSNTGGLLRTFRGHLGDVETVAFTPDGQKVISAGDDQSAILWNIDGGQPCDMLADTPVDGWISGLAFTPDNNEVIGTGSCDGAGDSFEAFLTAWNLADANRPLPLQTSSRSGVAIAFSPDGRQMVVGESSPPQSTVKSRVRIWSLDPARVLATVPKLAGSVYSVAYSNDGRSLLIGTGDVDERVLGSAQILEPSTGFLQRKLPDLPGKVEAVFSSDSRFVITVNSSKKRPAEIRMWNPSTGELAGQIENPRELDGLTTIALSPDGRYLVTGHGDPVNPAAADKVKIKVWDLSTRQVVGLFPAAHPAAITRLEFSRRGTLLASGDMAGNVRIWDFASRKLFPKQIASQGRPIMHMAFDKMGERLAVAADEKCLRVWHIDTARQLAILELSMGVPNVLSYTQDGKLLAAATSAGGLFLWDSDTYKPRAILRGEGNPGGQQGHGGVITCVAPLLTDKLLTGSVDKTVRIWDLKTRTAVATAYSFNQAVSCMAVSPDGRTLAVGTGKYRSKFETGELVLCALDNRQPQKTISKDITPVSLAFSPDGNSLAVCSLSPAVGTAAHSVNLIDLRTGHAMAIGSTGGQSVAFSPDGRLLAVGCTNGQIDLWPLDATGSMKPFILKKHQALVWSVVFSPDGKTLASGGADNNVVIWDVPTGEDLMTLKHNGMVESLRFSPDGRLLASASHEPTRGSVCLWHAPTDEEAADNPLRATGGPMVSDRSAGFDAATTMRPTDTTHAPSSITRPVQNDRRAVNPVAQPSSYALPDDDRYSVAPGPAMQPAAGVSNPSVRLQTGGAQPLNNSAPSGSGLTPPGGFSVPPDAQQNPNGGRSGNGRRARPAS